MLWTLIALLSAGLGAAGIALIVRKISGNTLPKWLIPASAGLGMLAYQIGYEYSWYGQQQLKFPKEVAVVAVENNPQLWRPWTYAFSLVHAYTLLDQHSVRMQKIGTEQVAQFMLYRVENSFSDLISHRPYVLNCMRKELLPLTEKGEPQPEELKQLSPDNALLKLVCNFN